VKKVVGVLVLLMVAVAARAQSAGVRPPCPFDGALLRDDHGAIVRFDSNEMKKRATHKEDLPAIFKMIDGRAVVYIDVLVGPKGEVICSKAITDANGIFGNGVEKAMAAWTFEPDKQKGKPVAYLGRMEFTLCDEGCQDGDWGMTLLK
jgi:hypothetical protein